MERTIYSSDSLSFSKYLAKCFMWMFFGLLVTFLTSAVFSYSGLFLEILMRMGMSFIIIFSIIEVILVISLSRSVYRLSYSRARSLFLIYSIINGITLSSIFYIYELTSIIYVFLGSAAIFGIMSIVGYTTKLDLSKLRNFIFIALIGMILMGIILSFAFNETAYILYSLGGIGLFMIITTYDIQMIKRMYYSNNSIDGKNSLAVFGALQLYLDFINIFIHLLSLLAKNRD